MTDTNSYQTPEQGTLDWHIPLNENFELIESDVQNLASELGISNVGGYNRPEQGTLDWHIPLNENFEGIETDVQNLASEVGVSGVGGYNRPEQGTLDWHIPLNENFEQIESDIRNIAHSIGSLLSGMETLSNTDVWASLLQSGADLSDVVYDATEFSGATLAQQVENAFNEANTTGDNRGVVWVPSGSYDWDQTVSIVTGPVHSPMFLFDTDARIDMTADWAFEFKPDYGYTLVNEPRNSVDVIGGEWINNGTGIVRADDIYSGLFAPSLVRGGRHALLLSRDPVDFSEGWSVRGATFEGVDNPLRFEAGGTGTVSHDQQLLANLTFRDFEKAVYYKNANAQNYTAVNLLFENPRADAVGIHFTLYTTGTIYNPKWTGSSGTVIQFDATTIPSIVDPDVADGATLSQGTNPEVSSGVSWQKAQDSPIITNGGPVTDGPYVRTDAYSGKLPSQLESAASDLPNGGTVVIPGQDVYTWDSTAEITLDGRDIAVVTPRNVLMDVATDNWALDITGDGRFSLHGGLWQGRRTSSQVGWLKTDVPNVDISPSAVFDFTHGSGIVATPRSKGKYRIYDTKLQNFGEFSPAGEEACVQIGGAGCSKLSLSHIETAFTSVCYRFDAPMDDFDGMRLSAHPNVDQAVFADANATVDGTWYNVKWEAPGRADGVVFDNSDSSTAAPAVEPWAWGGSKSVELWRGTKPQFFPEINTRVDTKFEP